MDKRPAFLLFPRYCGYFRGNRVKTMDSWVKPKIHEYLYKIAKNELLLLRMTPYSNYLKGWKYKRINKTRKIKVRYQIKSGLEAILPLS